MKTYLVDVQYDNYCGEVVKQYFRVYGYEPAYDKAHSIFTCDNVLSVEVTNADTGEIVILLAKD
jgi:hypothetical protein